MLLNSRTSVLFLNFSLCAALVLSLPFPRPLLTHTLSEGGDEQRDRDRKTPQYVEG